MRSQVQVIHEMKFKISRVQIQTHVLIIATTQYPYDPKQFSQAIPSFKIKKYL